MGQLLSCKLGDGDDQLFAAIREGDLDLVKSVVQQSPCRVNEARCFRRNLSPLHLAASTGQLEALTALLERGAQVDALDRYGKTPLMLACKKSKWVCAERLLDNGANVLILGSCRGRTCLHYAAKGGNFGCLEKILTAATSGTVANSWGIARFVNIQDRTGITPLHLASLGCHAKIVRLLLNRGALASAVSLPSSHVNGIGGGRTPLHFAAVGGSVDCVRELLAWGADRSRRDNEGYTAYGRALEYHNFACAALLNPNAAEPLVWPSPLKFMNELEPEAKILLEAALTKANEDRERQRRLDQDDSGEISQELSSGIKELCCICFARSCNIEVQDCGHRMCATCTLTLCCHSKPDPSSMLFPYSPSPPACPFCRCHIGHLVLARPKDDSSSSKGRSKSWKGRRKPTLHGSGRIVDAEWI